MSNKGTAQGAVWREMPIEQAVIASHHRINEETAAAATSKWSCSYWNKLDLAVYVPFMRKNYG